MILSEPSSETTASRRLSGEKEKALILWFESFHAATGLNFWFFELTDFWTWMPSLEVWIPFVPFVASTSPFWLLSCSDEKMASSFSLS